MRRRWREHVPAGQSYQVSVALDERRMPIAAHDHDFAEVLWVIEGSGLHRVNRQRQWLHAGQIVFIRPADLHALEATDRAGRGRSERFRLENVAFPCGVLRDLERRYGGESNARHPWGKTGRLPATFTLDAGQKESLAREIESLRTAPRDRRHLDTFLLNLLRLLQPAAASKGQRLPDWLQNALTRFAIPDDLSSGIRQLQKLAGCSPEHFSRAMRTWLNCTPTEWVNARRLDHAARLLEASDLPVTEVAWRSGFENLGHFHRLFRGRHGTTPLRHRREVHAVM